MCQGIQDNTGITMDLIENLSDIRHDYTRGSFTEKNALKDPFEQFKSWFQDAIAVKMLDPNALVLSTATKEGKPSSRVLLLKNVDERGFVFFTNYEGRKGKEIDENPNVSMLFYWDKLERQIRIEGKLEKITPEESDAYFQTRPYSSRLGAWASKQSEVLKSRFTLIRQVAEYMFKFKNDVPLPPFWGGYRLIPEVFEFWQGRSSRLHDRIRYFKEGDSWKTERLYP